MKKILGLLLMVGSVSSAFCAAEPEVDLTAKFKKLKIKCEDIAIPPNEKQCYELSRCYDHGWGTERDSVQRMYWLKRAAKGGHPQALEKLKRLPKEEQTDSKKSCVIS